MLDLVVEHDVLTNEIVEREMTADEVALRNTINAELAEHQAEQQAKEAARASALAKLAELGLTAEEIDAL